MGGLSIAEARPDPPRGGNLVQLVLGLVWTCRVRVRTVIKDTQPGSRAWGNQVGRGRGGRGLQIGQCPR